MSGWWIAWGRTETAASATFTCALALGCLTGNTFLAAGVAAGVASFGSARQAPPRQRASGALLPVWPRSRFQPEACWGSVTLPQRWRPAPLGCLCAGRGNCRSIIRAAQCPCQACRSGLKPCRNRHHRCHRHRLRSGVLSCTPYGNCQPCSRGHRQGGGCGNPILYNRWDMPIFARIPKNLYGE